MLISAKVYILDLHSSLPTLSRESNLFPVKESNEMLFLLRKLIQLEALLEISRFSFNNLPKTVGESNKIPGSNNY